MEVIPFTLPGSHERTINVVEYEGPHFYRHLHRHKEYQLMWIIEGTGSLIIDHIIHPFRDGDMFLIGPNQPHVFKSDERYFEEDGQYTVKGLGLFFSAEEKFGKILELPELQSLQTFIGEYTNGFMLPSPYVAEVGEIMIRLLDNRGPEKFSHLFALLNRLQVLEQYVKPLSTRTNKPVYSEEKANRIQRIYDYLLEHYQEEIPLGKVAREANLTPPAFCRYFKKHTGKTFVSFLNELRINEACKRLIAPDTEIQISEIAYKCGFNSVTNFNRVFKRVKKVSPSVFQVKYFEKLADAPKGAGELFKRGT